jgi:aminoglycoside phosphotransferase (APT) family kinase protein
VTDDADHTRLRRVVDAIRPGATLLRAWPLEGGVSALVTAVDLTHPDGTVELMVVRRHGKVDTGRSPEITRHEFRLLQILHTAAVPAPAPLALDTTNTILPTPYFVASYVDGTTAAKPADPATSRYRWRHISPGSTRSTTRAPISRSCRLSRTESSGHS